MFTYAGAQWKYTKEHCGKKISRLFRVWYKIEGFFFATFCDGIPRGNQKHIDLPSTPIWSNVKGEQIEAIFPTDSEQVK